MPRPSSSKRRSEPASKGKKSAQAAKRAKPPQQAAGQRQRRSPDDLFQRIVEAARGEFERHGFAGTTTARIASQAQVTEAQLFRYFGSKSNLFRETIFKPIDGHLQNFISEHALNGGPARQEMTQLYTSELQRFIRANAEMLTSLVVAQAYDSGTAHGVGKIDSLRTYFDHSAAMMRARIKGKPRIRPELMVRLAFASVLASIIFRDWIFPDSLAGDREIEMAINDFVLEGLAANSARR
jgi:AcrR family transcriptional regulator